MKIDIFRPIKIINLKWLKFEWMFDTWGSKKNEDKLLTNVIRIWAISGLCLISVADFGLLEIFVFIFSIIFIGITDVRYFRNRCKKLEIKVW